MDERIDNKYLTASHRPGEVILAEDMNELEAVVKQGINANYEDIQKIEDGTIMVGNASQLQGATLSTYDDSELSDDDNKFPSSRQVKRYIDNADSTLESSLKSYVDDADLELGGTLDLSIDSNTYVVTASLKNTAGTILSTKTIDLPLETMVVDADYDPLTREIILTLQSGSTVRFSVAALVSGLQSEITNSNKLNSDLVDDTNQSNKFITSAGLTKLSGIETGAQVNIIESITVNGTPLTITDKGVSLTIPTKVSDLTNDSGFITKNVDDLINYTDTTDLNTALAAKQATLISGTNIKTINNYSLLGEGNITIESSGGTSNYDELNNRPQINSITLTGNKSLSDLGIQPAGNYLTSESDPVFTASAAHDISSTDITNWNGKLDSSKVKTINSSTSGDVYDVNYVNSLKTTSEDLTLLTSGWVLNQTTTYYEYTITNANVTTNHKVDIDLDIDNQPKITGKAYTQTFEGSYKIITNELPTEAISCTAYITKVGA